MTNILKQTIQHKQCLENHGSQTKNEMCALTGVKKEEMTCSSDVAGLILIRISTFIQTTSFESSEMRRLA